MDVNIIKLLIKFDLSPVIKIVIGISISKKLKINFELNFTFLYKLYVAITYPKHKIKEPTTASSLKKLTILVLSGLS